MRASEGAALAQEMRVRLANIEAEIPVIEDAAAGIVDAYQQRVQKRINELLSRGDSQAIQLDAGRLAQEVAISPIAATLLKSLRACEVISNNFARRSRRTGRLASVSIFFCRNLIAKQTQCFPNQLRSQSKTPAW